MGRREMTVSEIIEINRREAEARIWREAAYKIRLEAIMWRKVEGRRLEAEGRVTQ